MAALWQLAAFLFRALSIHNPTSVEAYSLWFILILVAPLWTNAFVYMVVGRMVYNFLSGMTVYGIRAWRFGYYFVLLDVTAFIIQLIGAGIASSPTAPVDRVMLGLHIYMGGVSQKILKALQGFHDDISQYQVGFQQLIIGVFFIIVIRFHKDLRKEHLNERSAMAWRLLYVVYIVLSLITLRIIFRLVEYSNGLDSSIPRHEAYMYCLDTLPMLIAIVLFNIIHPGAVMSGKGSDIPGFRQRRRTQRGVVLATRGEQLSG
ncbi:MAG: hypothetical protein M1817_005798 [Caeruleum heppii]|nr:MAG: hypothetical protein M1817_005798 [Caeruleum heppii]